MAASQNYPKPAVGRAWAEIASNPADIITLDDTTIATGWPLTGTPPSRQRFNFLLNWMWAALRYFMQVGLPNWDGDETYRVGSTVIGDDGNTYRSLVANNNNLAPSGNPGSWTPWGLTLAQINASQLTQINISTGDASTKVANTNFVAAAISALNTTLTNALNAAVATIDGVLADLQNQINALHGTGRTAFAGGYYKVDYDGTIHVWGSSQLSATFGNRSTGTLTFPADLFTSPPTVVVTGAGRPRGSGGDSADPVVVGIDGNITTAGATLFGMCPVPVGGGGATFDQAVPVTYYAVGF
jgi:hypothetical protein